MASYDIEMTTEDTLELDTIIKNDSDATDPITKVETSSSYNLNGFQTKTAVFDPEESGEYDIHINGQILSINVTDASAIPDSETFQGMATGSVPDGFSETWDASGSYAVQSDTGASDDYWVEYSAGSDGRYALLWSDKSELTDQEVLIRQQTTRTDTDTTPSAVIRGDTRSAGNEHGYVAQVNHKNGKINILKYVDGNATVELATGTKSELATTSFVWIRFGVEGTNLKVRFWVDGNGEPSSWDLEISDSDISSGYVGFRDFHSMTNYKDYIGIGDGFDAAPRTI